MKRELSLERTTSPKTMAVHLRASGARKAASGPVFVDVPPLLQAQYTYITNDWAIRITGYTGPDGVVTIPSRINGLPVTRIEFGAFHYCTHLSSITVPTASPASGMRRSLAAPT